MANEYKGEEKRRSWHLEKGFSVAIVISLVALAGTVFANCAVGVWFAGRLELTVQQDHEAIAQLSVWKDKQDDDKAKIDSNLATMNQKLTDQGEIIHHIDELLERGRRGYQ